MRFAREHRVRPIDEHRAKIEELVVRFNGRVPADAVQRRMFRPWIAEPGLWVHRDWGHGAKIGGRQTQLWCAWLVWSRFRW